VEHSHLALKGKHGEGVGTVEAEERGTVSSPCSPPLSSKTKKKKKLVDLHRLFRYNLMEAQELPGDLSCRLGRNI
jgi:hypothetical protein